MELLVERTFAIFIAISGPILTIFDLPGNTLLLLTSLMFAFFDEVLYFNGRLLSAMVLIYALGEFWEFCVFLSGIKSLLKREGGGVLPLPPEVHPELVFDAPAGISGEARPAGGVEGVYGFHQANGADGNQIVLLRGESIVFLCDVRH